MRKTLRNGWPLAALALAAIVAVSSVPPAGHAQSTGGAWLGVTTQDLDDDLREGIDYTGRGVLVARVIADSPADRAGIRKGDVIVSLNSRTVDTPEDLVREVRAATPGQRVSLRIVRDGDTITETVTLGDRDDSRDDEWRSEVPAPPAPPAAPAPRTPRAPRAPAAPDDDDDDRTMRWHSFDSDGLARLHELEDLPGFRGFEFNNGSGFTMLGRGRLGVRVEDLNDDLASYFQVPGGKGALVVEVLDDTPAERAGLKAGDVITRVGDTAVDGTNDLQRAVRSEEGSVSVTVVRKGASRSFEADLGDAPRVMRLRDREGARPRVQVRPRSGDRVTVRGERDELRRELEQLREELRQLRRELREEGSER
jgi:membrane-associated protease RseP (regulator of RpoE activity)